MLIPRRRISIVPVLESGQQGGFKQEFYGLNARHLLCGRLFMRRGVPLSLKTNTAHQSGEVRMRIFHSLNDVRGPASKILLACVIAVNCGTNSAAMYFQQSGRSMQRDTRHRER
jgi:hypothetical protein